MSWDVEFTDEFGDWWDSLTVSEQEKIAVEVTLLRRYGPSLPFPHSSQVKGSRHGHMRELRIQVGGRPFRVLYAFNPDRVALLLIGGDKTGDGDWYEINVRLADRLYDEHLRELEGEKTKGST